jgi:hypothetical protein
MGKVPKIFVAHVKAHWPRYVLSTVTATFTFHAAWVLTGQAYYGMMAILLAEGMWLYWFSRIESFENVTQMMLAGMMFIVSSVAIVTTDIASAILIANANNTFALYSVLPPWVEEYITKVTPILASSNLIVYGLYEFFSDLNADKRKHESEKRATDRYVLAADNRMKKMKAQTKVLRREKEIDRLKTAQIRRYGKKIVAMQEVKVSDKGNFLKKYWSKLFGGD